MKSSFKNELKLLKRDYKSNIRSEKKYLIIFGLFFLTWLFFYGFYGIYQTDINSAINSVYNILLWLVPSLAVSILTYFGFSYRPTFNKEKRIMLDNYNVYIPIQTEIHENGEQYALYQIIKSLKEFILHFFDNCNFVNKEHHLLIYKSIRQIKCSQSGIEDLVKRKIIKETSPAVMSLAKNLNTEIETLLIKSQTIKEIPIYFLLLRLSRECRTFMIELYQEDNVGKFCYDCLAQKVIRLHTFYVLLYDWMIFYKVFDSQRYCTKVK